MADALLESVAADIERADDLTTVPCGTTLGEMLDLFARMELARRDLEAAQKRMKERIEALKDPILEAMAEAGITNAKAHGLSVFGRLEVSVSKKAEKDGVTTQLVCDALRAIGRGDMVSDGYSGSSLKSLVCEWRREGQPIPEELAGLLNVYERVELTTRL